MQALVRTHNFMQMLTRQHSSAVYVRMDGGGWLYAAIELFLYWIENWWKKPIIPLRKCWLDTMQV